MELEIINVVEMKSKYDEEKHNRMVKEKIKKINPEYYSIQTKYICWEYITLIVVYGKKE